MEYEKLKKKRGAFLDNFGYRLKSIRITKKITIKQLANRSSLSELQIFKIESNEMNYNQITINDIFTLCFALNVSLNELIGYLH